MDRIKEKIGKTRYTYILNTLATILLFAVIYALINFGVLNRYQSLLLIPIGFNIILAVSLNLTAGYLGQLPLGHAGFMSVGGYASALFTLAVDLPPAVEFPLAILIAALSAAVFGVLIGLPALRLKGDYLAIITLGFGEIIRVIITNLKFTGGAYGLKGIEKHTTVTWVFICVTLTLFIVQTLMESRHGRAILSIREDEIASEASGISTTFYKVLAFTVSAALAGVAGALYAHYLSILDPNNFGFMKSTEILVMVVLGGLGSTFGSIVAAVVLTLLPEWLRSFSEYRMVVYALVLILVMIYRPSGLCGKYEFSLDRIISGEDEGLKKIKAFFHRKKSGKEEVGE